MATDGGRPSTTPQYDPFGLSAAALLHGDTSAGGSSPENHKDKEREGMEETGTRRGRRRRSSELPRSAAAAPPTQAEVGPSHAIPIAAPNAGHVIPSSSSFSPSPSSSSRLWWQRGPHGEGDDGDEGDAMDGSRPRLHVDAQQAATTRSYGDGDGSHSHSSQSEAQDRRRMQSPAASFLSSMNERLASPGASLLRGHSQSYSAAHVPGPSQSHSHSLSPPGSPATQLHESAFSQPAGGLGALSGAAAALYERQAGVPSSSLLPLRPDDEGAYIVGGRYRLGRAIGFGGFSTVREAWDTQRGDGDDDDSTPVAVKIVYGQPATMDDEVTVWRAVPRHAHLLPLLDHERIDTDSGTLDFLVMPLCAGSLLQHIRHAAPASSAAAAAPVAHVTGPRNSAPSPLAFAERTGSGFKLRMASGPSSAAAAAAAAAVDAAMTTAAGAGTATIASPPSPNGSGLLRRASSRASTSLTRTASLQASSVGVPLAEARDIMAQLARALLCLHRTASIVHGDIKLENVLASPASTASPATTATVTTPATTCWRLADFGLARAHLRQAPSVAAASSTTAKRRAAARASDILPSRTGTAGPAGPSSAVARRPTTLSTGGSLAYAAPEIVAYEGATAAATAAATTTATTTPSARDKYGRDMWALGCILYALVSGRLPFVDSFEPRLQQKIARGEWAMPARLARRRQRLRLDEEQQGPGAGGSSFGGHGRTKSSSGSSSGHGSLSRTTSLTTDLSASLPALDMLQGHKGEGREGGGMEAAEGEEEAEDEEEEEDAASDAGLDTAFDGTSSDRISVRTLLRGLLHVDPSRRWTIDEVAASPWLALAVGEGERAGGDEEAGEEGEEAREARRAEPEAEEAAAEVDEEEDEEEDRRGRKQLDFGKRPTRGRGMSRASSSLSRSRPRDPAAAAVAAAAAASSPSSSRSLSRSLSRTRAHSDSPSSSSPASAGLGGSGAPRAAGPSRIDDAPAHRSSTSRSRSRAPDSLRSLLDGSAPDEHVRR